MAGDTSGIARAALAYALASLVSVVSISSPVDRRIPAGLNVEEGRALDAYLCSELRLRQSSLTTDVGDGVANAPAVAQPEPWPRCLMLAIYNFVRLPVNVGNTQYWLAPADADARFP
jgi:hypothetical protein